MHVPGFQSASHLLTSLSLFPISDPHVRAAFPPRSRPPPLCAGDAAGAKLLTWGREEIQRRTELWCRYARVTSVGHFDINNVGANLFACFHHAAGLAHHF